MPPDDFFKQFSKSLIQAAKAVRGFQNVQNQYIESIQQTTKSIHQLFNTLPPRIFDIAKTLKDLDKAGLTPNLGERASLHRLKEYQKLIKCGYPIFWVPRAEIVEALLTAKTETERKNVIRQNRALILEDCRKVAAGISRKGLKDARLHLESAIEAALHNNDRSAQSTASVCIDAQLDQIINTAALTSFSQITKQVHNDSKKFKSFDEVPINVLYAALQSQLIAFVLRDFNRLKPNTVRTKYSRNSSIHSVSARQYSELNTLQAIMIATSILATSDKLGKGWLTDIAGLT